MDGQATFLKEEKPPKVGCYTCKNFAELKTPRHIKDEIYIYGYCFKKNGVWEGIDQKGYAVYLPEGTCKEHKK